MKFIFILFFSFSLIASCSSSPDSADTSTDSLTDITHPTAGNIPSEDEVADILAIGKHQEIEGLSWINEKFIDIEEYASIGKIHGEQEEIFGRIEDAAIDSRDRVFLLDSGRRVVGVFSADGEYLATLGGRGQGPGEFENPRSLAIIEDQLLLVSHSFSIEVFDISSDMKFEKTVQFERPVNSMCVIGDTLFIQSVGFTEEDEVPAENYRKMIHAYSLPSFDPLFSFGQSYQSRNPMIIGRMSPGSLSCNEASSMVVFAFERMNVIQGYSSKDGSMQWVTRIDDLNTPVISETIRDGRPAMSYGVSESGLMDMLTTPVAIHEELMLLQVLRTSTELAVEREFFTFALNTTNGMGSYVSDKIPEISAFNKNGYIISRGVAQDLMVSQVYRVNLE